MTDTLILFGGAVKALGNGKVGGHLVLFSTSSDPDISEYRDFFTKATDYDLEEHSTTPIYYQHGLDDTLKHRKLGRGEMKSDDVGIWLEAQLELRDKYEQAVYKLAEAGKLGWSSGTAPHLVERKKVGEAHEVLRWPLGLDASLTPNPAEPRTAAVGIKSLTDFKAELLGGDYLDAQITLSALGTLYDALMNRLYGALYGWDFAADGQAAPLGDRIDTARACFDEYRDEAIGIVDALMRESPTDATATKRLRDFLLSSAPMKSAEKPGDGRAFEKALREILGYSRRESVAITNHGFKAFLRDAADDDAGITPEEIATSESAKTAEASETPADAIGETTETGETPAPTHVTAADAGPPPPDDPLSEEVRIRRERLALAMTRRSLTLDAQISANLARFSGA